MFLPPNYDDLNNVFLVIKIHFQKGSLLWIVFYVGSLGVSGSKIWRAHKGIGGAQLGPGSKTSLARSLPGQGRQNVCKLPSCVWLWASALGPQRPSGNRSVRLDVVRFEYIIKEALMAKRRSQLHDCPINQKEKVI